MATQNFQFIDATKHDRETRRLARSHAMKGKNAGRKLHRRSRRELWPPRQQEAPRPTTGQDSGRDPQRDDSLQSPPLIDSLQYVSFPVVGLPESQYIINHFFNVVTNAVYLPALSGSLEEVRLYWLRVLFQDRISYHCTVTLMHTFNDFFTGRNTVSQEGLYHLSQAVSMVNQTLDTPAALSLSNLTVVNLLILQAMLKGGMSTAAIHLAGMRRMLELRGGLSKIEEDWLAVKFCKTEFDYALHYGTPMALYRDRMDDIYKSLAAEGFQADKNPQIPATRLRNLEPSLQQVMFDMWNVSDLFNTGFKMDANMLQDALVSIGCRLIRFHPLGEPPLEDWFEEACHAGMIAFTTTFVIRIGPRRFLQYSLVGRYLKDVISRGIAGDHSDLLLWLLVIGGISVLSGPDLGWIVPRIRSVAATLGIRSWEGVKACFSPFPWIDALHEESGKELWSMAVRTPL